MTQLVLGSASSGRLSVLRHAGVEPLVIVSDVDEDAVMAAHSAAAPAEVVRALALAKAECVANAVPEGVGTDCVVVGCDSMLYLDGRLCGKPGTPQAALAQWKSMAGRSGDLLTGHCLIRLSDGEVVHTVAETASTTVYFATPTENDLNAYLRTGEPLGVAGGFTLDGLGGWFIDRIDGDPSNVIGISLPLTRTLLQRIGLSMAEVWWSNGN